MTKTVIIMRGLPGSGKSTYVDQMRVGLDESPYKVRVVSTDYEFTVNGQYQFDASKLSSAHAKCYWRFIQAIKAGDADVVIVDNTNSSAWEISPYVLGAQAFQYKPEIHELECDPEVAASRNIHGVPRETILKMAERMKEPLPPFWERRAIRVEKAA